jgi:hypothetical protein
VRTAWVDPNSPSMNCEAEWDNFDSDAYFDHNYRTVREDDREIMAIVRDFLAQALDR